MIQKKLTWLFFLFFLQINSAKGAYGNYGKDLFDILGVLVGFFFLWALVRIIEEGNAQENSSVNDIEIIDHFFENGFPEE